MTKGTVYVRMSAAMRTELEKHGQLSDVVRGLLLLGLRQMDEDISLHQADLHRSLADPTISDVLRRELASLAQTPQPRRQQTAPPAPASDDDDDFWDVGISV
jgi:hypothetical protein